MDLGVRLELVKEEDMLKASRKTNLTHLALLTGKTFLCLGLTYGLLAAPICWRCLSCGTQKISHRLVRVRNSESIDVIARVLWWCRYCKRAWDPEVPWADASFQEHDLRVCAPNRMR